MEGEPKTANDFSPQNPWRNHSQMTEVERSKLFVPRPELTDPEDNLTMKIPPYVNEPAQRGLPLRDADFRRHLGSFIVYVLGNAQSGTSDKIEDTFTPRHVGYAEVDKLILEVGNVLGSDGLDPLLNQVLIYGNFDNRRIAYEFMNRVYHLNKESLWLSHHPTVPENSGFMCPDCKIQVTEAVIRAYPLFPLGISVA